MNETCGMPHEGVICGKPAVEWVDIPANHGYMRIWLCAYHYDLRKEMVDGLDVGNYPRPI